MEEIQTKKLNLKALHIKELREDIVLTPEKSAGDEKKSLSGKGDEASLKQEDPTDIPFQEKEVIPQKEESKQVSLSMLRKPTEPITTPAVVEDTSPVVEDASKKEEIVGDAHIQHIHLQKTQTSENTSGEKEEEPQEENPQLENGLLTKEKETENKKSEEEDVEEEEEIHTIASPSENHDNTAVINAVIGEEPIEEEIEEDKEEDHIKFQNYESGFKKQSSQVLKSIQNFRYTPKTRVGFIVSLIILTVFVIGGLMTILPEKHSFSLYKASILEIYQENIGKKDTVITPIPDINIPEIPVIIEEEVVVPEEIPVIIEEEQTPILTEEEIQVIEEKKEKVRQHLFERYSSRK